MAGLQGHAPPGLAASGEDSVVRGCGNGGSYSCQVSRFRIRERRAWSPEGNQQAWALFCRLSWQQPSSWSIAVPRRGQSQCFKMEA